MEPQGSERLLAYCKSYNSHREKNTKKGRRGRRAYGLHESPPYRGEEEGGGGGCRGVLWTKRVEAANNSEIPTRTHSIVGFSIVCNSLILLRLVHIISKNACNSKKLSACTSLSGKRKDIEILDHWRCVIAVNVDIFAAYIFLRKSRLSNVRENMYT